MSMETDVRDLFAADETISGLVSGRIYPAVLPQHPQYPAISYSLASLTEVRGLNGPLGREMPRLQIDAWAVRYADAKALASAIKSVLNGHKASSDAPGINGVYLDNSIDFFEPEAGTAGVYRVLQDFIISYQET